MASKSGSAKNPPIKLRLPVKSESAKKPPSIKLRLPVNVEMLKKKTPKGAKAEGQKAAGKPTSVVPALKLKLPGASPAGPSPRPRGARITEFIADKQLRLRSYIRRRPIPFKRMAEMDAACGTKSLLLQFCPDFDECLYCGDEVLTKRFLSDGGLKIVNVEDMMRKYMDAFEVRRPAVVVLPTPPKISHHAPLPPPSARRIGTKKIDDDEDFAPTVKERKRKASAERREMMEREKEERRSSSVKKEEKRASIKITIPPPSKISIPLKSENSSASKSKSSLLATREAMKSFKTRRESLFARISETDSVCDSFSFLVILVPEKESAYFHGHPALVSKFFSSGVSRAWFEQDINVRPFEADEVDLPATCSVPHCLVARNYLPRWRHAAVQMFKYPAELPFTLHAPRNPEERLAWMAEIDLDPGSDAKVVVCSLHFKEGGPTVDHPNPCQLLRESDEQETFDGSARVEDDEAAAVKNEEEVKKVVEEDVKPRKDVFKYVQLVAKNKRQRRRRRLRTPEMTSEMRERLLLAWRWRRGVVKRAAKNSLGAKIVCRFTGKTFTSTKEYFQNFLETKVRLKTAEDTRDQAVQDDDDDEDDGNLVIDEGGQIAEEAKTAERDEFALDVKYPVVSVVTEEEKARCHVALYAPQPTKPMNARKKYVCAVCKSVCDLHGLFLHMKQVHKGLLCQYCLKLFKKVSDLEGHMRSTHRVSPRYFPSVAMFNLGMGERAVSLVCSNCNAVVRQRDLENHSCTKKRPPQFDCPFCDRSFGYRNQLDLHLSNGWCKGMVQGTTHSLGDTAKMYKILTGLNLCDEQEKENFMPKPGAASESAKKANVFTVSDKNLLGRLPPPPACRLLRLLNAEPGIEGLPSTGSVLCGEKSKGMNNHIRHEITQTGYHFDLKAKWAEAGISVEKVSLDGVKITRAGQHFVIETPLTRRRAEISETPKTEAKVPPLTIRTPASSRLQVKGSTESDGGGNSSSMDVEDGIPQLQVAQKQPVAVVPKEPPPKRETKSEKRTRIAGEITANLYRMKDAVDRFAEREGCKFCYQSRSIAVDATSLLTHLNLKHDLDAVLEALSGENPAMCATRIRKHCRDIRMNYILFRYTETLEEFNGIYRCCYCMDKVCLTYGELVSHIESSHGSKTFTCQLCDSVFINYGSYLCHVCYGPKTAQPKKSCFGCRVCGKQDLSTYFDYQFHFRKAHNVCEICMVTTESQEELYQHCRLHFEELMCMKCFLTYDDALGFNKHLFNRHEEEHKVCKVCHDKTWPHVYHFCGMTTGREKHVCEVCEQGFVDFRKYRVHLRTHTGANPYLCNAANCASSYISRQLLWKHQVRRHPELRANAAKAMEERRTKRALARFEAGSVESVSVAKDIVESLLDAIFPKPVEEEKKPSGTEEKAEAPKSDHDDDEKENERALEKEGDVMGEKEKAPVEAEFDPIAAAVASIMGPDGDINIRKSPMKQPLLLSPPRPLPSVDHQVLQDQQRQPQDLEGASNGGVGPLVPGVDDMEDDIPVLSVRKPPPSSQPGQAGAGQSLLRPRPGGGSGGALIHRPGQGNLGMIRSNRGGQGPMVLKPGQHPPQPPGLRTNVGPAKILPPNARIDSDSDGEDDGVGGSSTDDATEEAAESPEKKKEAKAAAPSSPPVVSSIWNQDLMFMGVDTGVDDESSAAAAAENEEEGPKKGLKTLGGDGTEALEEAPKPATPAAITRWELDLSESSGESDGEGGGASRPKKPKLVKATRPAAAAVRRSTGAVTRFVALKDHDYCYQSFMAAQPKEDLSEMDKILSNVALGAEATSPGSRKKKKKKKKRKKHKKSKRRGSGANQDSSSSSDSEGDVEVGTSKYDPRASATPISSGGKRRLSAAGITPPTTGPRPKYHKVSKEGVTAGTARPVFSDSEDEEEANKEAKVKNRDDSDASSSEPHTSDFDTDFEADDLLANLKHMQSKARKSKPSARAMAAKESAAIIHTDDTFKEDLIAEAEEVREAASRKKPGSLKLKIKLPPTPKPAPLPPPPAPIQTSTLSAAQRARMIDTSGRGRKRQSNATAISRPKPRPQPPPPPPKPKPAPSSLSSNPNISEKMRLSLALNAAASSSESDSESDGGDPFDEPAGPAGEMIPVGAESAVQPAVTDSRLYCVCQSPHDDVSEMIGCDADDCAVEWFHFECVGIMVPPEGKWYCPECSKRYSIDDY